MRATFSLRTVATAAGLALPLVSLPALADPRAWVDPPAKDAASREAPVKEAPIKEAPRVEAAKPAPRPVEAAQPARAPRATLAAETPAKPRKVRQAERPERAAPRHAPPRRLAETPAANTPASPVYASPARVEAAQALAMDYLSVVSSPGEAMVGATSRFYGSRVRFYGRPTSLADLLDEKRGFVRRWPERRYAARGFNTRCTADGSTCVVRVLVDFRAASPERRAVSKGASELVLEVSFAGQRPVIVAESGRVLHRGDDRAETLAQGAGRG